MASHHLLEAVGPPCAPWDSERRLRGLGLVQEVALVQNVLVALSIAALVAVLVERGRRRAASELETRRELRKRPPADRRILELARTDLTIELLDELREPMVPWDRERAVGLALAAFENRVVAAEPAMI